jgi:hypothetical protein
MVSLPFRAKEAPEGVIMLSMCHRLFQHQAQYPVADSDSAVPAMHTVYTATTLQMPTNQWRGMVGRSWFQRMVVST